MGVPTINPIPRLRVRPARALLWFPQRVQLLLCLPPRLQILRRSPLAWLLHHLVRLTLSPLGLLLLLDPPVRQASSLHLALRLRRAKLVLRLTQSPLGLLLLLDPPVRQASSLHLALRLHRAKLVLRLTRPQLHWFHQVLRVVSSQVPLLPHRPALHTLSATAPRQSHPAEISHLAQLAHKALKRS